MTSKPSTFTSCSHLIERSTGKVYDEPCHRLMGHDVSLPNTDWVAENHWCVPLYYRAGMEAGPEPAGVGAADEGRSS